MGLAYFRMLIREFLNTDPDMVPQEAPIIVLDGNYTVCMADIGKDTKHISTFLEEYIFKGMGKTSKFTRFTGVKEV